MSTSPILPLSDIVDVVVQVSAQSAVSPQFNQGLIIGSSAVIPSIGANSRVRQYSTLAGMIADGFTTGEPEYIAASLYFSQLQPPQFVWIGRQNLTALNAAAIDAAGTLYVVGDVISVSGGTAGKLATFTVTSVNGGGGVTGLAIINGGDGYTAGVGVATTGGTGSGLTVTTTGDVGDSYLIAATACRAASSVWWAFMCCGASDADALALASFAQSMAPVGCYFHTTGDAAVLNNVANNIAAQMKALSYTRTFLNYSTTQSGVYPNNIYSCAAAMGLAMGLNTGLPNSAFTLMFKTMVGVGPEPLTQSQVTTLTGLNVNFYVTYNQTYTILQAGITPSGTYLDQTLFRDVLAAAIQYNVMNVLVGTPKVPQTDPGETQLIHAVNLACQASVITGYLAPGTWEGATIINLSAGDPLPQGFLAQAYSYANQTPANRALRQAMPVYVAVIEGGAVQSVLIGVYIQP